MDKVQLSLKSMKGFLCLVLSGLLMSCKLTEPQKTIQLESRSDNTLWVIHPYRDSGGLGCLMTRVWACGVSLL